MKRLYPALLLAALVPSAPRAQADGVSISGQWIRALGGGIPAAGYFILRNDSGNPVHLTGAASPDCGSLTLHQTVRQHTMSSRSALDPQNHPSGMAPMPGMSMMQPVAAIPVPAHGSIRFAPGGYHLMCEQPTRAVQPGQRIEVTLRLDGTDKLTSAFPVKGPRGE